MYVVVAVVTKRNPLGVRLAQFSPPVVRTLSFLTKEVQRGA
jgi:hypothetical protein